MKATGIVRRIDDLGRVVIPRRSEEQYVSARGAVFYHIDTVRQVLRGDT